MKKRGVSLVALVVTIIVLIILSGAVILRAVNTGIFQNGIFAINKWNDNISKEDILLDNIESEFLSWEYKTWREIADTQVSDYTKLKQEEFALLFQSGEGTESNPYIIANAKQLACLAASINDGLTYGDGKYYKLNNDINLGNLKWTPIGYKNEAFVGFFDGNGYSISNVFVQENGVNIAGLFGTVLDNSIIEDITITSGSYFAANYAGGIAGKLNNSQIKDCTNYANISTNREFSSGIVAAAEGTCTIENCVNYGQIATKNGGKFAAGIVGAADGQPTIKGCINNGDITGDHQQNGGIVGYIENATVEGCINNGNVIAKMNSNNPSSGSFTAGIAGYIQNSTISSCINNGDVTADNNAVGGIAGRNVSTTITDCYNSGKIKVLLVLQASTINCAGGIAGDNRGIIEYCYNTGVVEAADKETFKSCIGGITGLNTSDATISYCYSNAELVNSNRPGGVVGQLYSGTLTKNFYYDENVKVGIGHSGTDYGITANGSDVSGQAQIVTQTQANSITNFEEFKTWIEQQ